MIKLLVADDEHLVRQALVSLLSLQADFQIVGQVANGEQAVKTAVDSAADVVLMDIQMPVMDGVAATALIKKQRPHTQVLVLTTYDDNRLIADAMKSGAGGYLLKDAGADEIAAAVRAVHQGYTALGASIAPKLVSQLAAVESAAGRPEKDKLTPRERELLRLLKQGMTNAQMAGQLGITEKTIRDHMVNILAQLNLRDRTQAALWAQRNLD
ncbi:MAG TPA: response regulator transcription factor [Candidatus Obscuribacterales bacterium]